MNNQNKLNLEKIKREKEEEITQKEARKHGLPYENLSLKPIDVDDVATLPEKKAREAKLAVVHKAGDNLIVALADPDLPKAQQVLSELDDEGYELKKIMVSESSLEKPWKLYERYSPPEPSLKDILPIEKQRLETLKKEVNRIEELRARVKNTKTRELIYIIVMGAINFKATDIHLEPGEDKMRLRFRIDGILQDIATIEMKKYRWLLSRIKILADLKVNIHNINQDGRFKIAIEAEQSKRKEESAVRVSIIPEENGETVVMRLLGVGVKKLTLDELGLPEPKQKKLEKQLAQPNGIILATGPTSSGKSTSLYSFLKMLNEPEVKIITIEDPIEYNLPDITQSQVNKDEGYTFETALEATLRQNPEIMLVGEMRDPESAQIALQAASTGHLVFSTLHTNDAAGAISRLKQLGIDPESIPSAVNAVVGQRLVRKLCPHCKKKRTLSDQEKENIEKALSLISPKSGVEPPEVPDQVYEAQGCPKCNNLGYQGRTGIFEIFTINDVIEKLINEGATTYEIRARAMQEGMVTMLQDGLMKVIEGVTSLEEVHRVAGEAKYIESLYGKAVSSLLSRSLDVPSETAQTIKKLKQKPDKLEQKLRSVDLEKLARWIAGSALELRATDIHIEPKEDTVLIRFRVDGVLEDIASLSKDVFLSLVSEIKTLSGLKEEKHAQVQEGRFKIKWKQKTYDTRVSIIPGGYGETIVIRLLRPEIQQIPLKGLGIRDYYKDNLNEELNKTNGIILTCGPTSAGKTTTLYAMLSRLNKPGVKALTIEDPIEYSLEGIIQTQVEEEEGYTFSKALKSILRQNPNIIMIGEIRDPETAQTAIRASQTGHLVLSTLHTNSAPAAIQRLINLEINPKDISSALNMVISQRLVRKLCEHCKKPADFSQSQQKKNKKELKNIPDQIRPGPNQTRFYTAQGCDKCGPSGYKGQTGVFEIMFNSENLSQLISEGASTSKIKKAALKQGMLTVRQDALLKAARGTTSIEEVNRIS